MQIEKLYDIILDKLTLHLQAIKQCYLSYYQVIFNHFIVKFKIN